ncbi:protein STRICTOSIDINE SYNTHASE-LIKE 12-like [Vigna radiata var. radiata]|uniref:Protein STRICTOSIDINE SYNTHASE-LIKE 12-like n=1 Tax=Vigna radiata var. radiata TaxID=3916 RepID=A0A1S3VG73_VIGRR|nr:protein STRICTOSIDINE SYNTHASE-LIKE 12-like [Vigna radiata var. radiata]
MLSKITMVITFSAIFMTFLLCSPSVGVSLARLPLPSPITGPESLAFDRNGGGPYVGVSDGRILKYVGPRGFQEYGYTSPTRNKTLCDGLADFSEVQAQCGRPLGLRFNHQTNELYVADAYFGLVKIGPNGGAPIQSFKILQSQENRGNFTFDFLDGIDIDMDTGIIYLTQASTNFRFRDARALENSRDQTGSLFSVDPKKNETRVLMRNLALAAGVAVSRDGSFVVVSEYLGNRIQRFWLKGPRANSSDLFLQLRGRPDNIRTNSRGQFWIAVNDVLLPNPPSRPVIIPRGLRVGENGVVSRIVSLVRELGSETVSEVHEHNGTLYSGSLHASYVSISTVF